MSDCFDHMGDAYDDLMFGRSAGEGWGARRDRYGPQYMARATRCNKCGSEEVRLRQQGGKWVLFSFTPGVMHTCPLDDSAFPIVTEE